jgi:hypothetical protein
MESEPGEKMESEVSVCKFETAPLEIMEIKVELPGLKIEPGT